VPYPSQRSIRIPEPRVQLNTHISPELKARVTALALERGCFTKTIISQAITAYLARADRKSVRAS
jgi:predicted transcriptional regulator